MGRVLIIDDEPVTAESLCELLTVWGHEALTEADGLAGLQRAEEFEPNVIITDVNMPRLDGFGLLREVRVRYPEIAVILLTGQGSVEMAVRAMRNVGIEPNFEPIRGGTDGSQLTERGVPTPNLFTGMQNIHGPLEWVSLQDMAQAVRVCAAIGEAWTQPA